MTSKIINVINANIGRKRSLAFRKKAFRKMRRRCLRRPPLFQLQEIDEGDPGDEKAMVRDVTPHYGWRGLWTRTPVGAPADYYIRETRIEEGHDGLAGESYKRFIVSMLVEHKKYPWLRFVVMSSHRIRRRVAAKNQDARDDRIADWEESFANEVSYWVDGCGETVICGVDANDLDLTRVHPREQRLVANGVDYVLAIEPVDPKVTVELRRHFVIPLGIDSHKAHGVRLKVTKAK